MLRDAVNDLDDYSEKLWDICYELEGLENPPPDRITEWISDIAIELKTISENITSII